MNIQIIDKNGKVDEVDYQENINIARHSAAHILAEAVKRLYPDAKLAIGPAIENGFYYDFDNVNIKQEDLRKIENVMKNIIGQNKKVKGYLLSKEDALVKEKDEQYKKEMIEDLVDETEISFFENDDFFDMCVGPHVLNAKDIGVIKLLSVTGAYWKGSEKNKMLTRIYGTCFETEKELKEYLDAQEEALKRDHKKLGKELELFMIANEGPGFPFFLPKGMVLRNILEDFWRKIHVQNGYQEIKTPIILNEDLWHRSGHWDHYKDNMYTTKIDELDYALKPMNCPGGMIVYKSKMHSYREFPIRMGELGLVHRHEKSGQLNGLFRVRCFTQDDAHIFCLPTQIESEIVDLMNLIHKVYSMFGFTYDVELSTRPEDSMGEDSVWEMAESALKNALENQNVKYTLNEGDGAFYGPKIDFHIKDCLGRSWQCGTIQLDFQMPEKFDLTYIDESGEKKRPVMLHRVIYGSVERMIGILIEHYAGAFPLWLSPVQARILTISDAHREYANEICDKLNKLGFRIEIDARNEKIGYKIREARLQKIPYMLVVGDKEVENDEVAVKSRTGEDKGTMKLEDLIDIFNDEITSAMNI